MAGAPRGRSLGRRAHSLFCFTSLRSPHFPPRSLFRACTEAPADPCRDGPETVAGSGLGPKAGVQVCSVDKGTPGPWLRAAVSPEGSPNFLTSFLILSPPVDTQLPSGSERGADARLGAWGQKVTLGSERWVPPVAWEGWGPMGERMVPLQGCGVQNLFSAPLHSPALGVVTEGGSGGAFPSR